MLRIQHRNDKKGIYQSMESAMPTWNIIQHVYNGSAGRKRGCAAPMRDELLKANLIKDLPPKYKHDFTGHGIVPESLIFGFVDEEQMFRWFAREHLIIFSRDGFELVRIQPRRYYKIFIGDVQAAILREGADITETLNLENFVLTHG